MVAGLQSTRGESVVLGLTVTDGDKWGHYVQSVAAHGHIPPRVRGLKVSNSCSLAGIFCAESLAGNPDSWMLEPVLFAFKAMELCDIDRYKILQHSLCQKRTN